MTQHVWYYYPVYEEDVHLYDNQSEMFQNNQPTSYERNLTHQSRVPKNLGNNINPGNHGLHNGNFGPNNGWNHNANQLGPNNQWNHNANQWGPNNQGNLNENKWNNNGNQWDQNNQWNHYGYHVNGPYPYPPYNPYGGVAPFLVGGVTGAAIASSNQPQTVYYPYPTPYPTPATYPQQPYAPQPYPQQPGYAPYGYVQQ